MYKNQPNYFEFYGSIGAYAKLIVGPITAFETSWKFKEGTIFSNPPVSYASFMTMSLDDMANPENHKLIDRSYKENESVFMANDEPFALFSVTPQNKVEKVLKTNVYPYAEPLLAEFSDGTRLAVWLDDNAERSDINRTSIYWSYYNGSEWSEPCELCADGTGDYSPKITVIDDVAYLVWVDTAIAFEDTATLEEVTAAWNISCAVFENGSFDEVVKITSDNTLDSLPQVFGNSDNIFAAWISISDNNIFSEGQTSSIKTSLLSDGVWSVPSVYATGLYLVDSFSGTVVDGDAVIAYSAYSSADVGNTNMLEVYLGTECITDNSYIDSKAVFCDGVLYWFQNGSVCAYSDGVTKTIIDSISTDRFDIFSDGENKMVVFAESESLISELYAYIYDKTSDSWSDKIQLTDFDCAIGGFSGAYSTDGNLSYLINCSEIVGVAGDFAPYGETSLSLLTVTPSYNLSLDSVSYIAETLVAGNVLVLDTEITNNGELTVDKYLIDIYSSSGKLLNSTYSADPILPGQTHHFEAYYELGDSFEEHTVKLVLTAIGCNDFDSSDNTCEVELSYNDVALENVSYGVTEKGEAVVYAEVVNRGYNNVSGVNVSLRTKTEEGEIVETQSISEELSPLGSKMLAFTVALENDKLYFVTSDMEDDNSANNTEFIVFSVLEEISGDINTDGVITIVDVLSILESVLNDSTIDNADLNGDGKVSLIDVLRVLKLCVS